MNKNRKSIYSTMRSRMQNVGFLFEREQTAHHQKRKEKELKFISPLLIKRLESDGHKVRAKKFYIKPLSDDPECEIGFVTGKSSPLLDSIIFPKANSIDTFGNVPAWVNREGDRSLDKLLLSIDRYLGNDDYFPELIDENLDLYEGVKKQVTVNKYERNPIARARCVEFHGYCCMACGFDFRKVYGDVGKEFIHVHHIKPLHTINENYRIDYQKDLIPVCPNCHAMLHRRLNGTKLTIEELKERIKKK